MKISNVCCTLAIIIAALAAGPAFAANKPTLVVLDIELTGDTGGPRFAQEHDVRIKNGCDLQIEDLKETASRSTAG